MSESITRSAPQLSVIDAMPGIDELTIGGVFAILKRRRRIIVTVIAVCFLLAVVACFFLKPRYKSVGEIEIQKSATDGLGLQNLTNPLQTEQTDALNASLDQQTQVSILQSPALALRVIKDLNLDRTEDFKPTFNPIGMVMGLLTPAGAPGDPKTAALEDSPHRRDHAVAVFQKRLKVTPVAGTRLIDIQYTSSDPKIAAAVVNDVQKTLVDFTLNNRSDATSQVSTWLSGQLGEIKHDAEEQQAKVENLQRDSGVYSLGISDAQGKEIAYSSTLDRLQQATQELSAATSNRISKGALFKTIENGDPELISGLAGSSLAASSPAVNNAFLLMQNLRTQQAALSTQLATDSSKLGSANPKLADEKASLDSINTQIALEVNRIGQRVENDYKTAQAVEDKVRTEYNQERELANNQNDKAIALLIARQEANDTRSLYQTLYSRMKEAGVVQGLRSSNISVIDVGRSPSRPSPDIPILLALSVIIGSFFGVTGALFVDATSDRIETMATIERALQTPILAILPVTHGTTRADRALAADAHDGSGVAVLSGPRSAYGEALRGLRTSLLLSHGSAPKTILLTSAAEKEGKSTTSLNLAALLVLNGSRVLLVDADMRSAGLSGYMGFERGSSSSGRQIMGLSDALLGIAEPNILTPFSQIPNLSVLCAGSVPTYPSELLGSVRMRTLLTTWEATYDYVVIDSPPILAVADPLILSRMVDTTLLIARHGQTTKKSLERAYKILHSIDNSNVGVVVNGVERDSVSFNEFYGYKGTSYYSEA